MAGKEHMLIAGNWKMNLTHHEAINYLEKLDRELQTHKFATAELAIMPPFTALYSVQAYVAHHRIPIVYGAQDLSPADEGAFTGDIAGPMLTSLGCTYVLIGHSERRQHHLEDDQMVRAKIQAALRHGLTPILCVGEGLDVRRKGGHVDFTLTQVRAALADIPQETATPAVVAYEPVWAIGTGEVATPADAQEVCAAIRTQLGDMFTPEASSAMRIIYGGSVTAANISDITACTDVNGALVGGASLNPEGFAGLCHAALTATHAG
jgi:triosephosphate isomerase (TIM)